MHEIIGFISKIILFFFQKTLFKWFQEIKSQFDIVGYSHISINSVTYNEWCIVFATAFCHKDFINIEIIFQELFIPFI